MDGFFIIDKPTNINSHEVSSYVKKFTNAKKAGHAGTLDPNVSGLLIVGINRATKLLQFLTKQNKVYVGIVRFKKEMSYREISKLFSKFVGVIKQTPPKESAVAKRLRRRKVYYLKILEIKGKDILFKTKVESGTYIRTLCKDMGGEMIELRRTDVGPFNEREAYKLDDIYSFSVLEKRGYGSFMESSLISVEEIFERLNYPKINISLHTVKNVIRGAPIYENGIIEYEKFNKGENTSVFMDKKFVGVGRAIKDSKNMEGKMIEMKRVHLQL